MKALVYNGPRNVSVKKVPDPKIEQPTDVLVRITTTNIYTCTRAGPIWSREEYLATRTSAR